MKIVIRHALFFLLVVLVAPSGMATPWLQTETESFRIIYQEQDEYVARRVVAYAEDALNRGVDFLNYRPGERIPVVIYGQTVEANGFFSPLPPHIAIFVAAPTENWFGPGDWVEGVFFHELVHYLHVTRPVGLFGSASRVLGPSAISPLIALYPGFMVEGPTVYAESTFIPGGRGESPIFEAENAAIILEGEMYSFNQAAFGTMTNPGRYYNSGFLLVDYLQNTYGDDAFAELNRRFVRWPFFGAGIPLRRMTGTPARQVYADMVADLENRWAYRRDIPVGTSLTPPEAGRWSMPAETERGLIALSVGPYRQRGMYLYQPEKRAQWELLVPLSTIDMSSWAVDTTGATAIIAANRPEISGPGGSALGVGRSYSELWEYDLVSGNGRQITRETRLFQPTISRDGTTVIALEQVGSYSRVVQVDRATGAVEVLLEEERTMFRNPSLSRDGRLLAVGALRDYRSEIVVIQLSPGGGEASLFSRGPHVSESAQVMNPRVVQTGTAVEIWYGGSGIDRPDSLLPGVYRSTLAADGTWGAPELMVEDRFGAVAGYPSELEGGGTIFYSSYHSGGTAIRRVAHQNAPGRIIASSTPAATSPANRTVSPVAAPIPSERYRDMPRPAVWLPILQAQSGGTDSGQFDAGFQILAPSILGNNNVSLQLLYNPVLNQPSLDFSWMHMRGPAFWDFTAAQRYVLEETVTEGVTQVGVEYIRPIVGRVTPHNSFVLSGSLGVDYTNRHIQAGESSWSDLYTSSETVVQEEFSQNIGLVAQHRGIATARDLLGPVTQSIQTAVTISPPVFAQTELAFDTETTFGTAAAPFNKRPGMFGALQTGAAATLVTSTRGRAIESLPYRISSRRFTNPSDHIEDDLGYLGHLRLDIPVALTDRALGNVGILGWAFSTYLEQGGGTSGVTDFSILGTEVTGHFALNVLRLVGRIGFAQRLPHGDSTTAAAGQFYLSLGGGGGN